MNIKGIRIWLAQSGKPLESLLVATLSMLKHSFDCEGAHCEQHITELVLYCTCRSRETQASIQSPKCFHSFIHLSTYIMLHAHTHIPTDTHTYTQLWTKYTITLF